MILVASSINKATVTELNPRAIKFFKSMSTLNATIFLNSILESEQIDCSISSAMAKSLMHGSLLWATSTKPSGLVCCVITLEDYCRTDALYRGMVLDLSTKHKMDATSLNKLTKMHVKFPDDADGVIERFCVLTALYQLLFGRWSLPALGLKGLVNSCQDSKRVLRGSIHQDRDFIPKIMYAVNQRLYTWLSQCSNVSTVEQTTIKLLDYPSLFKDVMMQRFQYNLPASVRRVRVNVDKEMDAGGGRKERINARSRQRWLETKAYPQHGS